LRFTLCPTMRRLSRNKVEKAASATADLTTPPMHRNRLGLPSRFGLMALQFWLRRADPDLNLAHNFRTPDRVPVQRLELSEGARLPLR
jgi:hypothetical protein